MAAASTVEKPSSKGQAWFCTTGLPSDIMIEIENMSFHLHKFPLMSKSGKLHNLITEKEAYPSSFPKDVKPNTSVPREEEDDDEGDQEKEEDEIEEFHFQIVLSDFPGGSDAFEMAAKFCYGVKIDLTSSNVVPVRCAGEFLEMTQEYSEDNLISKTERFISQSVLKSFNESVKALKSCDRVMHLAENLGIVQRCIDSISSRASSADPSVFGWPVSDGVKGARNISRQILWNDIDTGGRRKSGTRSTNADSWLEDLTFLSWPLFKRLIFAFIDQDLSPDIIESCLMNYAKKNIPGVSRSHRKESSSSFSIVTESQQRELLETIIENLPLEKSSRSSTPTRFLFGLLRTAYILNTSEACRATIEKKIGSQLEQATLDDLLVPSYSYLNETLYDVDCVDRILAYFLDEKRYQKPQQGEAESNGDVLRSPSTMQVGKLFDGYLSEIASDANIKPDKFYDLATSLPEHARLFDDGLYRAVDLYLKAHPWISEAERQKICEAINYQKLTLEACTHAAQNERLPLRAIVQVLFFEQLQLRHAIAGSLVAVDTAPADTATARPSVLLWSERIEGEEGEGETEVSAPWRATVKENQVLRLDMDSMRTRVHQLERECSSMRKVIEKIDKGRAPQAGGMTWRGSLTRRFGCKFKTQVCDSHEPTVADAQKRTAAPS